MLGDNCGKNVFLGSKNQGNSEKFIKNSEKIMACLLSKEIEWKPQENAFIAKKSGKIQKKIRKILKKLRNAW